MDAEVLIKKFPKELSYVELYNTASLWNKKGVIGKNNAKKIWLFLLEHKEKIHPYYIGAISFKLGELAFENNEQKAALHYFSKCLHYIPNHFKALKFTGKFKKIEEEWNLTKKQILSIIIDENNFKNLPLNKQKTAGNQTTLSSTLNNSYLISAIVSTYNSEAYIRNCLENLERQSIANQLEIIIVNSGSNQNEESIVKEFQKEYNNIVYIRTEERETIYKAWNRGIKMARGKYITNANTDDGHRKDAFEVMSRYLEEHSEISLVYGKQYIVDRPGQIFESAEYISQFDWPEFCPEHLFEKNFVGPQPMWRASIHSNNGCFFDEDLEVAGDYDLWLRISQSFKFKLIDEFLGIYYLAPDQSNKEWQNLYLKYEEQYKVLKKNYLQKLMNNSLNMFKVHLNKNIEFIDEILNQMDLNQSDVKLRFENLCWSLSVQLNVLKQFNLSNQVASLALSLLGGSNRLARHIRDLNLIKSPRNLNREEKVSIIIPYYNGHKYIAETLDSINNQSYRNFEVLIVDNGSEKSSREQLDTIVEQYLSLPVQVLDVDKRRKGPRRNLAVDKARGDFILPLDCDDQISNVYIEKTMNSFKEDPTLDVVFTGTINFGAINVLSVRKNLSVPEIYCHNLVNVTSLIKKSSFVEVGGYCEDLPGYEDWDLWIRFASKGKKFKHVPDFLFFYRKTNTSRGSRSLDQDLKKRLALMENNSKVYRYPEFLEMYVLEQNIGYISPLFLKGDLN